MCATSILLVATTLILSLIVCNVQCIESNSSVPVEGNNKILSRKRRYLIFPEGSSLQVVFDEIIPIVDYNNFLILGVTVALAWELPSKPPSEQYEDIRQKLNDGTLGIRKDENVNKIKYVDKPTLPQYPQRKNDWYNPYQKPVQTFRPSYINTQPYGGWQQSKRIPFWEPPSNRRQSNSYYTRAKSYTRHHQAYPIFGKRSIPDPHHSIDDILHLEYHRKSRHQLYTKIEKYFNSQGKHGEHCVLKLLCETGQRSEEKQPGSFLNEIMRAVFTFPEGHHKLRNELYDKYTRAHGHTGNCTDQYHHCPHQFFTSTFL